MRKNYYQYFGTALLFGLITLLITHVSAAEVFIKFPDLPTRQDSDGEEIATTSVGEVFALDIEIHNPTEDIESVQTIGFEVFEPISKSVIQRSSSINGKTTRICTIHQQVKALKAGLHKVGPVQVQFTNSTATSNECMCQIEAEKPATNSQHLSSPREKTKALDVELLPSKNDVYWGEEFDVTIRYILHDEIFQVQPEIPEGKNFFKKNIVNKPQRQILRNGKICQIFEQVVSFIPIKTGESSIGPIKIHYTVPIRQQQARRGGLEQFFNIAFGPQAEQKETDVAAITVQVKPLPKTKNQSTLVGSMTDFTITVDKPTAEVNEPIKLTVSMTGQGNLEFTEDVTFNLPKGCKVFKSKTSMHQQSQDKKIATKKIDYVLQVNTSGQLIFPAQKLTYFDPEARAYKSLSSQPIELFLTGDAVAQPTKSVDELAQEVNNNADEKAPNNDFFVFDDMGSSNSSIPWWLMLILMLAPLCLHLRLALDWLQINVLSRFKRNPTVQEIIKNAQQELTLIIASNKSHALYQFFIKLLAALWHVHEQDVTEVAIEERLTQLGWNEESVREFVDYIHQCASLHFTGQGTNDTMNETLLKKAQHWVSLLSTSVNIKSSVREQ